MAPSDATLDRRQRRKATAAKNREDAHDGALPTAHTDQSSPHTLQVNQSHGPSDATLERRKRRRRAVARHDHDDCNDVLNDEHHGMSGSEDGSCSESVPGGAWPKRVARPHVSVSSDGTSEMTARRSHRGLADSQQESYNTYMRSLTAIRAERASYAAGQAQDHAVGSVADGASSSSNATAKAHCPLSEAAASFASSPLCRYWARGFCDRGFACKYFHAEPVEVRKQTQPAWVSTGGATSSAQHVGPAIAPQACRQILHSRSKSVKGCEMEAILATTHEAAAGVFDLRGSPPMRADARASHAGKATRRRSASSPLALDPVGDDLEAERLQKILAGSRGQARWSGNELMLYDPGKGRWTSLAQLGLTLDEVEANIIVMQNWSEPC